ncbi:hypothetical protein SAMN02745824_1681 [Parasphingorhabdus marina DSM 22363]|uniref:Lipoprotein n=1 Tax=Parasphingorhabdus marina DSM 22363 TaxID=1123272 RepID=A0A1N6D8J1_9SPHN|nr:hypothetical protein [Parasphingorhabdus marina]SIN67013.1 hypothetical protein SAMN02745824_1681 [Parasphingorhabdus marina DSM 22363]
MRKSCFVALAAAPLMLTACSASDSSDGDTVEDSENSSSITIGGEGDDSKFSIRAEGFSMDVDMPSLSIDSEDFDLNNVNLYPGSKVTGMKIEDVDGKGGQVILDFVAPAGTDELLPWFEEKMTQEQFTVEKDGTTLSGTTDDGDPFELSLSETSADETTGQLKFSEK